MHVVIVANGSPEPFDVASADQIIAADGGARHALAWGYVPDVVIGDFDSLDEEGQRALKAAGTRFIRHPDRKDETDLELALRHAASLNPRQITILGAWGDRPDHTLANILLIAHPSFAGLDLRLVAHQQEIRLIHREILLEGCFGDLVSLIPIGGDAIGVSTEGLEYPLRDETLHLGASRGISNVMTAEQARIRLREGLLLCLHSYSESGS
jgi:thiamine pyrophosphokinase